MIAGVQDIYYSITDAKHTIRFYAQALGMLLLNENEFGIALDCMESR